VSERVTIADVAREVGVSMMTVSRVINDKGEVSPMTRQRVLDAIERLGYRPSGIARGLATQRTGTIGLIVPDVANPFFADVARGAEDQAYTKGYNVFLCNTSEDPEREITALESLEEKRVDGVVLCSSRLSDADLRPLLRRHPATVLVNRELAGNNLGTVMIDDQAGAQALTQHLINAGHQHIGLLAGPPISCSGRQRTKGYQRALVTAGLTQKRSWMRFCAPDVAGGQRAVRELLTANPELSAVVCYNDLVAIGVLQACADRGRNVPEDLAVVGFDDILLAALVTPPLTTVSIPRRELGRRSMALLLQHIADCAEGCESITLQPELIVRASAP
jgi:LacI family transcriptional regulator